MREQAEKLVSIEKRLSERYGTFELFALFLRENSSNKWDLLISSDWARNSKKESIDKILTEVRSVFTDVELLMLSRIIILDKNRKALQAINSAMHIEHGLGEINDCNFFGLPIKQAFLITSQRMRQ